MPWPFYKPPNCSNWCFCKAIIDRRWNKVRQIESNDANENVLDLHEWPFNKKETLSVYIKTLETISLMSEKRYDERNLGKFEFHSWKKGRLFHSFTNCIIDFQNLFMIRTIMKVGSCIRPMCLIIKYRSKIRIDSALFSWHPHLWVYSRRLDKCKVDRYVSAAFSE